MQFSELKEGKVYFLPVKILRLLPIQERIRICERVDKKTGAHALDEEAAQGYPFPPYVALWDGRCKYIGEDTYSHFMTASQIADLLARATAPSLPPR